MKTKLLLGMLLFVFAESATAYVCSRVTTPAGPDTGPSLSWFSRTIPISLHVDGTNQISNRDEFSAIVDSFRTWELLQTTSSTPDCPNDVEGNTDLLFDLGSDDEWRTTESRWVGYDYLSPDNNENIVVFWDEGWPHTTLGGVIALTTTTHIPQDGRIIDADIELNATNFEFALLNNANSNTSKTDLANTMVHEIGHLLGLAHTSDADATMFASATPGEILKRTLDCDDISAIAFKYPSGKENGYCDGTSTSCSCVEPIPLTSTPTITQSESFDSYQTGCQTTHLLWPLGLILFMGFARLRRRHAVVNGS